jgi:hypothetical protein
VSNGEGGDHFDDPDDLDPDALKVVDIRSGRPRETASTKAVRRKSGGGTGGGDGEPPVRAFADPATCPVMCLGKVERSFLFLSPSGAIKEMTAKELASAATLGELFDGQTQWLKEYFPSDKGSSGFAGHSAAMWLIRQCVTRGWFNPDTGFRGRGVWRLESGDLIVHLGDTIWRYGADGGRVETFAAGCRVGDHIYAELTRDPRPAEPKDAATAEDVDRVLGLLQSWNWSHPRDAEIMLGWIGAAMLAGALRWRPHIWVGGLPASGKSQLEKFVRGLFGPGAVVRASEPSRAFIVDALAGAARPVMLDELERNLDPAKQDMIIELSRLASTDDQSGIGRSSLSGRVTHKPLRAAMYFSAVARPPMRQQDLRRIYVTQLLPLPEASEEGRLRLAEIRQSSEALGAKLKARALAAWPRFRANLDAFDGAITRQIKRGGGLVDQLGTLLAMAYALLKDAALTGAEADAALQGFDLTAVTGDSDSHEPMECARHLLTSFVNLDVEGKRETRPVGELLADAATVGEAAEYGPAARALRRYGMRIEYYPFAGVVEPCLIVANRHQALEEIYDGSRWSQGVWAQFFDKPLGEACASPMRFSGVQVRAKRVPLRRLPGVLEEGQVVAIETAIQEQGGEL